MKDRILARRARFMLATLAACAPSTRSATLEVAGPIPSPSVEAAPQPPDADGDGDGVPDRDDKCPTLPGAADGCPARPCLSISTEVRILQRVEFAAGQSTLSAASFPILDDVAAFVQASPHVVVRIQGHGDATENVAVAAARELVVRSYLEKKGVDPKQLEHVTYGSTRPIAPNTTADGRQKNRRVDFEITKQ